MCTEYEITDASEFVEEWMAYTISKLNGADPTLDTLGDMARHEFTKNTKKNVSKNVTRGSDEGNIKVYGQKMDDLDDDIMGAYIVSDPMSPKVSGDNCLVR